MTIIQDQVQALSDKALVVGVNELADGLETEFKGQMPLSVATIRELASRYEELRWRMDGLEK